MTYFWPFVAALGLSFALTGIARSLGMKFNLVSTPRERDIHQKALPRIGGVAIFLSFLVISLIFFLFVNPSLQFSSSMIWGVDRRILGMWVGGFLITGMMLLDDIFGLSAWKKLAIQVLVALVLIASGIGIDHLASPFGTTINLNSIYVPLFTYHGIVYHFSLLSDLLTLVWLVAMMNIMNFVDGVDGLAGGLATIAAFVIFLLSVQMRVNQPATAFISIILAGASLGFLFWNYPPAKIFMGDSGSMFLGFMLGLLPLISGGKLATVFLVLGFPIVDGFIVAIGRIFRGKNPLTSPDKTHLHHRFLAAGFTPKQAILSLYLIAIAFGWVALRASTFYKILTAVALFAAILILIGTLGWIAEKRKKRVV